MITVIEQTTAERKQKIMDIFNQIRPLLDKGHSYASALNSIDPSLGRSKMCKEIKEYGKTQGYSQNYYVRRGQYLPRSNQRKNKHGLLNVMFCKMKGYRTGHAWRYNYFEDGRLKALTSIDLIQLRKKVEEKGLEWRVTDIDKARESYDLNSRLLENKRPVKHKRNKHGVAGVTKRNCPDCKSGVVWMYRSYVNGVRLSAVDPSVLRERVIGEGCEWIVLDEEKAKLNGLI